MVPAARQCWRYWLWRWILPLSNRAARLLERAVVVCVSVVAMSGGNCQLDFERGRYVAIADSYLHHTALAMRALRRHADRELDWCGHAGLEAVKMRRLGLQDPPQTSGHAQGHIRQIDAARQRHGDLDGLARVHDLCDTPSAPRDARARCFALGVA